MNIIPTSVVDAFAKGEILQVLFFSILFGIALANLGEKAKAFVRIIDEFSKGLFKVVHYIMVINGRPGLACHTKTKDLPEEITLMPLPVFKLVGDLSVDTGTWFRGMLVLQDFEIQLCLARVCPLRGGPGGG